jgi:hypothetical protein
LAAADLVCRAEEAQVLEYGEVGIEAELLRHVSEAGANLVSVFPDVAAADRDPVPVLALRGHRASGWSSSFPRRSLRGSRRFRRQAQTS